MGRVDPFNFLDLHDLKDYVTAASEQHVETQLLEVFHFPTLPLHRHVLRRLACVQVDNARVSEEECKRLVRVSFEIWNHGLEVVSHDFSRLWLLLIKVWAQCTYVVD